MKNKAILMIGLSAILITTVWFWPTTPAPPPQPPLHGKTTTESALENQIRLAKTDLHKAASAYLSSIEKFRSELAMREAQIKTISHCIKVCHQIQTQSCDCQTSPYFDKPRFVAEIIKSADQLKQAEYDFKSRIKSFRYDACKKLGSLCLVKETDTTQTILANLPATDLDGEIDKAIKLLPSTNQIINEMVQKHLDNIPSRSLG